MPDASQPQRVDSFYRKLQQRVASWLATPEAARHPCAQLYPYLPELFLLLTKVGLDPRVEARERVAILSALKYIIAPFDLIPEGILGPAGYCDDLVLAALTVERLASKVDAQLLRQHWCGGEDVVVIAHTILEAATTMVGAETCTRLKGWLTAP